MSTCKKCGKKMERGAIVCEECGTRLAVSKRPKGAVVVAILMFINASFSLIQIPLYNTDTSIFLGINLPVAVMRIIGLMSAGLSVYCAIGFYKLQRLARHILLAIVLGGMLNATLTVWSFARILPPSAVPSLALLLAANLAFFGVILFFIVRLRHHFHK